MCPFSFRRNVVQYTETGSKLCVQLTGAWEPSGGFTTVTGYVTQQRPAAPCPPGDFHLTIDNNQKVAKSSGRIREGSTVPVEICTAISYVEPGFKSEIMCKDNLSPQTWKSAPSTDIMDKLNNSEESQKKHFASHRNKYICEKLREVQAEQKVPLSNIMYDHIDLSIRHEADEFSVCTSCDYVFPQSTDSDRICPACGYNPSKFDLGHDPYKAATSNHPNKPASITIAEPCMVNPCSVSAVREVMNELTDRLPQTTKWVPLWSDGVPYLYASKLQDCIFFCETCNHDIDINDDDDHQHQLTQRVFGNFLLRPGPGHIELNMAKVLLDYLWAPLLGDVAKKLGFRTPRALDVVRRGVDHHRSRQLLATALEAITKELLVCYVRDSHYCDVEVSAESYYQWLSTVKNANYIFWYYMAFTALLAFSFFNAAVRKNNSSLMMASRTVFTPLFYGRPHAKYQELLLRDACLRTMMPPEVLEHTQNTESFSKSGNVLAGQGADFLQEEANRDVKSLLPSGHISSDTWRRVSNAANDLQELKQDMLDVSNVQTNETQRRYLKLDNEVKMVRIMMRKSSMLSPWETKTPQSVAGKKLDTEIHTINDHTQNNYSIYKQTVSKTKAFPRQKLPLFCLTQEERQKLMSIENKTKAEIVTSLQSLIDDMPDRQAAQYFAGSLEGLTARKTTKQDAFLALYYEACVSIDHQNAQAVVQPADIADENWTDWLTPPLYHKIFIRSC